MKWLPVLFFSLVTPAYTFPANLWCIFAAWWYFWSFFFTVVNTEGYLCAIKCKVPTFYLSSSHAGSSQTKGHQSVASFDVSMERKTKRKWTFLLEESITNQSLESQGWMNLLIYLYCINSKIISHVLDCIGLMFLILYAHDYEREFQFFLFHSFSQWIHWPFQIWKIQIILSEGKSGWHFWLPDFLCCRVGYACLCWSGECYTLYQWWSCCCGFAKRQWCQWIWNCHLFIVWWDKR